MKHSSNKKRFYRILSLTCGCVALAAIAVLLFIFIQHNRARSEYAQLSQALYSSPAPTTEPEPTPEPTANSEVTPEPTIEPTPEPAVIPIDFDYLQSLNSDVIGWIVVEGTDIDYPVLYDTSTDMYYLYHNYQGTYTLDGSIFMQDYNTSDFSDFNTVLYGHTLDDGMFSQLHRFEEQDFFDTYNTIVIYTNDRKLTYRVFAAYDRDDTHIMAYYDISTPETRQAYLDEIFTHDGLFDLEVSVSEEDHILSLSTCNGYLYERYIVQCVLISDEPGVYAGN